MMIINVEGGIGMGKSTLLNSFKKYIRDYRIASVEEIVPLKKLQLFLDKKLDALGFQLIMAAKRIQAQNHAILAEKEAEYVFMERSLISDSCFAEVCLPEEDKRDYRYMVEGILKPAMIKPDLTIYLRGSLEGESERIKNRGRNGENWYLTPEGTEYRKKINQEHDKLFLKSAHMILNPDELDFRDPETVKNIFAKIVEKISEKKSIILLAKRELFAMKAASVVDR